MELFSRPEKTNKYFVEYYQNPEYRQRHNEHMSEKIECECGAWTARANMTKHQRTKIHARVMQAKRITQREISEGAYNMLLQIRERKKQLEQTNE